MNDLTRMGDGSQHACRVSSNVSRRKTAMAVAAMTIGAITAVASGQSAEPTLFVGNNGNLEGSISSLHIADDGSLSLTDVIVTGTRNSTVDPCPGCNTYALSLSPDGKYLVGGHASSSTHPVAVSITRVHPDATLELIDLYQVPHTPLDVIWLNNEYFAMARSSTTTANNQVRVYHYDRDAESVTLVAFNNMSGFSTSLAVDRPNQRLFSMRSSGGSAVRSFDYDSDGNLTVIQTHSTGTTYPLGIGISPDGTRLYGGGGISNGGDKIVGVAVDPDDGTMESMPGSPYVSPGASPKQVVVTDNAQFAIAGHGTDATVRTFTIDQSTGALSSTGHFFDVGAQATLGNIATAGDLVFITDNSTIFDGVMGVYSFTVEADGALTQNGPIVDTGGIAPRAVAPWLIEPCPEDLTGDGVVNVLDLLVLLEAWGLCPRDCPADLNGDGEVNVLDLLILLEAWGPCPNDG